MIIVKTVKQIGEYVINRVRKEYGAHPDGQFAVMDRSGSVILFQTHDLEAAVMWILVG